MASNDSRRAAIRLYRKLHLDWIFNTSTFLGNALIALLLTLAFRELGHGAAINYVFFLTVLAIGLWTTEAIPPFAVGIFLVAMFLLGFGTDIIIADDAPVALYVNTWTSNVIWLLLGGFFLAKGMEDVGLDRELFRFTLRRFGTKPDRLLFGLMLMTAFGSMIMSNTATTAMMISSVLPLVRLLGSRSPYTRALLVGIPAAASVGGIGTIIGSTPNAIAVGALQERGISITFLDWLVVGFPTAVFLVVLFWWYLVRRLSLKIMVLDLSQLDTPISVSDDPSHHRKRYAVWFTLLLTVGLWLTEPLHGIPVAGTSAVPMVLLTLMQVVDNKQVRELPWDTLMLVAGGLALGIGLVDVGLAELVMGQVNRLPVAVVGIAVLFSMVGVLLSNVMSNTAAASILVPLGVSLSAPFGLAVPVIVAISCSCALLLPVSTPSNAIAYATGFIEQRSFRLGGVFFIVVGPLAAFVAVMIWVFLKG
ncbi:MAG: SLC13 family permease [Bernardetiaceae bacterium]